MHPMHPMPSNVHDPEITDPLLRHAMQLDERGVLRQRLAYALQAMNYWQDVATRAHREIEEVRAEVRKLRRQRELVAMGETPPVDTERSRADAALLRAIR